MSLNFLSPLYLFGLLGISIPVLIHLLTRRQQKHIRFSVVYLLFQSQKRSIKKSVPNKLLLLLFRCLGIALLSLALASPIITFGAPEDFAASVPAASVFILDDSYSMGAWTQDGTLYDEAVQELLALARRMSANSVYSVVLASAPGRVFLDWTSSPETAEKLLKVSNPSYRTTTIGQGLAEAYGLLESASQKDKRIFILTDRDKNGWHEEEFQEGEFGSSFPVTIVDLSERQVAANAAAVKDIEVRQEFLTNSRVIRVKTKITNLSSTKSVNRLNTSLWANNKKLTEGLIDLKPNSVVEKEFSFPLLENEPFEGTVVIAEDGLAADNRRFFTYQPDRAIPVLVVDGDPRTVEHQSESFYLERALNPFSMSVSNVEPTVSTLSELPFRNLYDFSVVMLCNVRELPVDYELELEKFVSHGGALFISLGDQVNAKFYNEKLGNLLPVTLESTLQPGKEEPPFRFLLEKVAHPVMKIFSSKALEEMGDIYFNTLYSLQPREGKSLKIPLWFSNRSPALVEFDVDKGKVILFASSLDRDWNNFPIQPTFLPWVQRWVKYSARGLESITRQELLVGEPFRWEGELPGGNLYIQTPGGTIHSIPANEGKTLFEDTHKPGVYRVFREPGANSRNQEEKKTSPEVIPRLPERAAPAGTFTVNIDTRESDPAKISDEEIQALLEGVPVQFSAGVDSVETPGSREGFPLAAPFILLMAGMLLCEGWLVRKE